MFVSNEMFLTYCKRLFKRYLLSNAKKQSGVYIFWVDFPIAPFKLQSIDCGNQDITYSVPLYVGKSKNILTRLATHPLRIILGFFLHCYGFNAVFLTIIPCDIGQIDSTEQALIKALKPCFNGEYSKINANRLDPEISNYPWDKIDSTSYSLVERWLHFHGLSPA